MPSKFIKPGERLLRFLGFDLEIKGSNSTMENCMNRSSSVRPKNPQGVEMGTKRFEGEKNRRTGRRALSAINQNLVGSAPQRYPCVVSKRPISEKSVIHDDKNLSNPVERPLTRKFAAQLQNFQQQQQDLSKSNEAKNLEHLEDCKIIDVEENKPVADLPVPMSLEQTDSLPSDKDLIEEVEMEDIFEEPVIDIDACDATNPLAVVDYVEDLYSYYLRMEVASCVSSGYMSQQSDINEKMRAILIDWLIEVHYKFELREETLFLTVNLIDRFLARQSVVRRKLQLVGLVAMLLACKYEEVSVPIVEDFIFISDKAYTRKDLLEMERMMLNTLRFNMSLPTPYVFLTGFLKAANSDKKLSLAEYEMVKFPPSVVAAAAVYIAQCALYGGFKQWNKTCEWYSNYSQHQLLECSRMMVGFHQRAGTGKLTGVYRKYSTSKYGYAAKCKPAIFLLQDYNNNPSFPSVNQMQ